MSNRTSCPLVSVGRGMGGGRAGLGRWVVGVAPSVWLSEAEASGTACTREERKRLKGHTHVNAQYMTLYVML